MELLIGIASIVGALAWVPTLIKVAKSLIKRPRLVPISSKEIFISHSTDGVYITIDLAFTSKNSDSIITDTLLELKHEDGATCSLEWRRYSEKIGSMFGSGSSNIYMDKSLDAIALSVLEDQMIERSITFESIAHSKEYHELVSQFKDKASLLPEGENIGKSTEFQKILNFYKKSFLWQAGAYSASFSFKCYNGDTFTISKEFVLTQFDVSVLEKNIAELQKWASETFVQQNIDHNVNYNSATLRFIS